MALKWRPGMTVEQEEELMRQIREEEETSFNAWLEELEAEQRMREIEEEAESHGIDMDDDFSDDPKENGWVGQDGLP